MQDDQDTSTQTTNNNRCGTGRGCGYRSAVRPYGYYSTHDVARLAGCTYRQIDYWARVGAIVPTREARGSGSVRDWSPDDAAVARVFYLLARHGATIEVLVEVRFALQIDPDLWNHVVVVGLGGEVRPVTGVDDLDGWIINLPRARDYVAREDADTKVGLAVA